MAVTARQAREVDAWGVALRRWKWDAVQFVSDNWPDVTLERWQARALRALSAPMPGEVVPLDFSAPDLPEGEVPGRVSVVSGHGVGKSAFDAWAVLWFSATHYPFKAPCTAPTAHQLDDVLVAELALWLKRSLFLTSLFVLKADRMELNAKDENRSNWAAFRTGNKANPEALQGFHSQNLMFTLDEASGIPDSVFVVAEGALSTPGARVLMTSNGTRRSGYFYESHHSDKANWTTIRVSCADSTQVDPSYLTRMARYGTDSNIYRVRVLGLFPKSDDDAVIPLEVVELAIGREVATLPTAPRVWGLDVARFGDDRNALARRHGNRIEGEIETWYGVNLMVTAGKVKNAYDEAEHKPDVILVDVIGLGAGVHDRLQEMGLPVIGVNVAESPAVKEKFMKLRDELWWRGREWFEALDCTLDDDDQLVAELTSVGYDIVDSSGRIKVWSKEKMKKELGESPDKADAFLLTLAGPTSVGAAASWKPLKYDLGWVR